jgi:hypothetical protein
MILVIVSGNLHDLSRQDIHQTLFHQRLIEGVRMVEIEQAPFRLLYLAGGQISVKTVLRDAHHLSLGVIDVYLAQLFHDSLAYRALGLKHFIHVFAIAIFTFPLAVPPDTPIRKGVLASKPLSFPFNLASHIFTLLLMLLTINTDKT